MTRLIELKDVCMEFDSKFTLDNLTFDVKENEVFGFLGPSGAGKTTTIKLLTKQLLKKSGSITLLGKNINDITRDDYNRIGIMSDTSSLYERMTIEENLKLFAKIRNIDNSVVEYTLSKVCLYEDRKKLLSKCSRGMKQRALLASVVLHKPKLLFLDEPTSGLDPATTQEIHELLQELNSEGTTIFLTTHNMSEADKLCNRVGILNQGKVITCGVPKDLKLHYAKDQINILTTSKETITVEKNEQGGRIISELMKKGECLSIHSNEPNLEEIFLQLTGRVF